MIHEEKWYTCDRQGERIENLVEDVLDCLPEESFSTNSKR